MNPTLFPLLLLLSLSATACPKDSSPTVPTSSPASTSNKVLTGTWGGDHLQLEATAAGASLSYDCGHGTIDEPLSVDANGNLDVHGKHFQEHGGPIRLGEETPSSPAHYTGNLKGDVLTITVQITRPAGIENIGTFVLKEGGSGRLFRCL